MEHYGSTQAAGFVRREYGRLVEFVRRRLGEVEGMEPEDIVQDVLVGLFDKADISAPIHNLAAYVYRSLRNRVVDSWRARKYTLSLDSLMGGSPLVDSLPAQGISSEKIMDESARWIRFRKELARLSSAEQAVIMATELDNWTFRELSREWNVPVGTLLARKSRALKKIKDRMAAQGEGAQGEKNGAQ